LRPVLREDRGLTLTIIRPFDVAAWVENHGAPGVKQQLAAVRMLFDWLITGQVMPMNPAAAVRGPKHVVKTGTTPVLDAAEWRKPSTASRPRPCAIFATAR
jgi:site-specific recombinase XerC